MMTTTNNFLLILLVAASFIHPAAGQEWMPTPTSQNTTDAAVPESFLSDVMPDDTDTSINIVTNETFPFLSYDLPTFEISLAVSKRDNALMEFQDRLDDAIRMHLETFYEDKLEEHVVGSPTKVKFDVESKLVWRELFANEEDVNAGAGTSSTSNVQNAMKHYEISGRYYSNMSFNYDAPTDNSTFYVSQSLMNLFFIEAFQGRHYWDLMHHFLQSPQLQAIRDVQITVLEDGFIPYKHNPKTVNEQQSMSIGMVVGIAFGTIFCLGLIMIWVYLCTQVNHTFVRKGSNDEEGQVYKNESVTDYSDDDDAHTNDAMDLVADKETAHLDMMARKLTSIPLRQPEMLPRRKRGQPTRMALLRPAHTHLSSLNHIEEGDNESCASTVVSGRTTKTKASKKSVGR